MVVEHRKVKNRQMANHRETPRKRLTQAGTARSAKGRKNRDPCRPRNHIRYRHKTEEHTDPLPSALAWLASLVDTGKPWVAPR